MSSYWDIIDLLFIGSRDVNDPWYKRVPPMGWVLSLAVVGLFIYGFVLPDDSEPPVFVGADWVPSHQMVCPSSQFSVDQLASLNAEAIALGWPEWPEPYLGTELECDGEAAAGEVRWKGCGLRSDGHGSVGPACPVDEEGRSRRGATYAQVEDVEGGKNCGELPCRVTRATIYTNIEDLRVARHERWHAAGILDVSSEGSAEGSRAHTTASGHVMEQGGSGNGLRWLDRTVNGDWPYDSPLAPKRDSGQDF